VFQAAGHFKKTALASAVLLGLTAGAVQAQPQAQSKAKPNPELDALKRQVQALSQQVTELREQLGAQRSVGNTGSAASPGATTGAGGPVGLTLPAGAAGTVAASDPARSIAASADAAANTAATAAPGTVPAEPAAELDEASRDALTSATKSDIQGIRTDFENYKYEQARLAERNRASVTRNTKIAGAVQVRSTWQNPAQNAGAANGATGGGTSYQAADRHTSFDVPSVLLNFTGNLYRDYKEGKDLTYALGFSYATNSAGNPGSSTSATRTIGVAAPNGSQFNLTNAFLTYSFFATNGGQEEPKGTISFGQQLVPFGLEAQADEEVRPVINSAQFTSALSGINARQIGIIYRGDAFVDVDYTNNYRSALLEYAFGVVNGSGPNKSDNNGQKDWLGRVAVTLPADYNSWLRQLKLGASFYRGYGNLVNTTSNQVVQVGKYTRRGFDVNWTHLPWSVAYEYVLGEDEVFTGAGGATAAAATPTSPTFLKKSRGQYVNFGYTWGEQFLASEKTLAKYDDYWPKSFQSFVRYDTFDADIRRDIGGDKTDILTLGLNAFFAETTKLQLNYLVTRNDTPANGRYTADRPRKGNAFQAQFQYGF
jgi:phosphate-selective porin/cell division septum initiation protein DivIVA